MLEQTQNSIPRYNFVWVTLYILPNFKKNSNTFFAYHRIVAGTINIAAISKKHNPLNWKVFSVYGYSELNMQAPINVHKVSRVAIAENKAPE